MTILKVLRRLWSHPQIYAYFLGRRLITPYKKMVSLAGNARIVADVGCGHGAFTIHYAINNPKGKIAGFDPDIFRIKKGATLTKSMPGILLVNGFFSAREETYDAIFLSDVLHHMSPSQQVKTIFECYRALKQEGRLVIKEICRDDGIRFFISAMSDMLIYPRQPVYFHTKAEWTELLRQNNFIVSHHKFQFTPLSINFFVAGKTVDAKQ